MSIPISETQSNYKSRTYNYNDGDRLVVGGDLVIRICDNTWLFGEIVSKAGKFETRVSVSRNLPWPMKIGNSMILSPSVCPVLFCMCKKM